MAAHVLTTLLCWDQVVLSNKTEYGGAAEYCTVVDLPHSDPLFHAVRLSDGCMSTFFCFAQTSAQTSALQHPCDIHVLITIATLEETNAHALKFVTYCVLQLNAVVCSARLIYATVRLALPMVILTLFTHRGS